MTRPRCLLPGRAYHVTRRVSERRFFLRPDREGRVKRIVEYSIGRALQLCPGVLLHAYLFESNHVHIVVSDANQSPSLLPAFFRNMNSMIARALNALHGRGERLWGPGSWDGYRFAPGDLETVEAKIVYTLNNPVQDGLVASVDEWPGAKTLPEDFGTEWEVAKPEEACFGGRRPGSGKSQPSRDEKTDVRGRGRKPKASRPASAHKSKLPTSVTIKISPPPGYEDMPLDELRALFRARVDEDAEELRQERRRRGHSRFMGVAAVQRQNPFESAGDTFPDFGRNPRVHSIDPEKHKVLVLGLIAFRLEYRAALEAWRDPRTRDSARFPAGTYWPVAFHGARVLPPSTGPPL